jgi:4-hydroxybenzoate polyprenyltransferase
MADPASPSPLLHALRPHHWVKNLLVFLPLVAAHRWGEAPLWLSSVLAFVAFCLCSSAVYLANDLSDLDDDRAHPQKRHRPLAAGVLSLRWALTAIAVLLVMSLVLAVAAGALLQIAAYALAALAYSFWLKTRALIDLFWLVGLYLLRVLAGAAATGIVPSDWLMALSALVFASLACAKRCAELTGVALGVLPLPRRRGYRPEDQGLLTAVGLAAAVATQIVVLLYLQEAGAGKLYARPSWLMLAGAVVLGWLMRVWLLVGRGRMQADPIVFALRDLTSLAAGLALVGCFLLAAG